MRISKITPNTNFTAKFIKNDDIMEVTANEIEQKKQDAMCCALDNLGKIKLNTRLELTKNGRSILVTNLYNGNQTRWTDNYDNAREIMKLSNPLSQKYFDLFIKSTDMTNKKATNYANMIANKYYAKVLVI